MKLIHLSDLHLGKRMDEYSLLEDQRHILGRIVEVIDRESPDAVIIAGDVYDKSVPSAEAVQLFDNFLVRLSERKLQVFVISGNHDSPERIAFGSRLMDRSGIHMSPVYDGRVEPISLNDEYGRVNIYMLPFVKPVHVRRYFVEREINSYNDALSCAVNGMGIDTACRNVLVTHQFVTGASRSESEEISVGGTDNVDASVFGDFDYVALGHLHTAQNCGSEKIRYCGTPLKYSFSEAKDTKSVTVVELAEKGALTVSTVPLTPLRDMVELRGTFDTITDAGFYEGTAWKSDYTRITLTDEDEIPDAIGKLRRIYHNIVKLDYDNTRTRANAVLESIGNPEKRHPFDVFAEFFEVQNGKPMSGEQAEFMKELISGIWEDEV